MERKITEESLCFGRPILTRETGDWEILPNVKFPRVFDMLNDLNALLDRDDEIDEISKKTLLDIRIVAHTYLSSLNWNFMELNNYLIHHYSNE